MSASASSPVDTLLALLRPQRLTAVVDVGANPIDGDTPYKSMLSRRLTFQLSCANHSIRLCRMLAP